ncbi:AraC family transcriptional regulator [Pokkaliibacter sp. MBI-7]|uniref:helix-turn-helix transcriptional regulator n=1 Tax=Pokkaliibacter sp. MBI-7 TaxID=3040600 RepID=UPI0024496DDE|nr:AraC family transcriptional regulator [Pokkaliibacter sp. MBI-7]MDH2432726.1 AraC family transcriptional regulator [Pokkaliibacter sp. MBI-7]
MDDLIATITQLTQQQSTLPFAVYSSFHEQTLVNVPIARPLLIFVLSGEKELGREPRSRCQKGEFVFLSDSYAIDIRNIPRDKPYFALILEFDAADFSDLPAVVEDRLAYFIGTTGLELQQWLQQFVQIASWAPAAMIALRRRELLALLFHLGYTAVTRMKGKPTISQKINDLFRANRFQDISVEDLCARLAMSDSTLRRKLRQEQTSVMAIKDRARLGHGLHLLQTTDDSINLISDRCGYQSQSRFTQRFKAQFGLTPTELRKTRKSSVEQQP